MSKPITVLAVAAWLVVAAALQAQSSRSSSGRSFNSGMRPSGMNSSSRPLATGSRFGRSSSAANDMESTGLVSGQERFLRENRQPGDFVGSAGRDERSFVGSTTGETSGPIRSSIVGPLTRTAPVPSVNRPEAVRSRSLMYEPRLRVGFTATALPTSELATRVTYRLYSSRPSLAASPIAVSVEAGTAILRGEVASAHEKNLVGLIASFEPGIDRVENQLRVAGEPAPPPSSQSPSDAPPPALPPP